MIKKYTPGFPITVKAGSRRNTDTGGDDITVDPGVSKDVTCQPTIQYNDEKVGLRTQMRGGGGYASAYAIHVPPYRCS